MRGSGCVIALLLSATLWGAVRVGASRARGVAVTGQRVLVLVVVSLAALVAAAVALGAGSDWR